MNENKEEPPLHTLHHLAYEEWSPFKLKENKPQRENSRINWIIQVCSHKVKILEVFHSKKNSHPTKLKQGNQILAKPCFR